MIMSKHHIFFLTGSYQNQEVWILFFSAERYKQKITRLILGLGANIRSLGIIFTIHF